MLSSEKHELSSLISTIQAAQGPDWFYCLLLKQKIFYSTNNLHIESLSYCTMEFTDDEVKEAKTFGEFYVDMMDNYRNTVKYYLSKEVVLDWFGKTIKGEQDASIFIKNTLSSVKHLLSDAVPARKIGFRDTHVVKIPKDIKKMPLGLMSPPRIAYQKTQTKTPKKSSDPSTSSSSLREREKGKNREQGQGDGFHNPIDLPVSPAKRFKPAEGDFLEIDTETVEGESDITPKVKYMTMEGSIEFHRPSIKKLQTETKWKRPCKLSVAYSSVNCHDCTIYLIIYEGNVKCRRNLMREFEAEEPEN